jgi:hypothetical protein
LGIPNLYSSLNTVIEIRQETCGAATSEACTENRGNEQKVWSEMAKGRDYFGGLGVDGRITLKWCVVSMYQPHETCHNTITAQGTMKSHSTTLEGSYCVYPSFLSYISRCVAQVTK